MDDRQYSYSWRNWSYGEPRRQSSSEQESGWSSWEEFNNDYGSVGEDEWEWTGEEFRQRQPTREKVAQNRHYAVLGVSVNASLDEVKQAYRRKAREYHPDLHPNEKEKYTAKMADINAAFDAIVRRGK
ncbi:MAG: DnaJ domain-containing protein [Anaerolineae bacterium]|nr:DnaJ domain-containing protein [Anaerolineae bacterium]